MTSSDSKVDVQHLCKLAGLSRASYYRRFEVRAPRLSPKQRRLSATMSVQLFKAVLPLLLQAEEAKRKLLVRELKTVLQRYLEPLLG